MSVTVTAGLHRALAVHGGAPAVTDGRRALSWSGLADRVARLAAALRAIGCRPGDRVAMLSANSTDYVAFYLAAPWADLIMVTLNTRWSRAEMAEALRDSGARLLIVDTEFVDTGLTLQGEVANVENLLHCGEATVDIETLDARIAAAAPIDDAHRADNQTVALFYTGGTTGKAKGVMLAPSGLVPTALALQVLTGIREDSVVLQSGPLFHMAAGGLLYTTLTAGARSVIVPRFDPAAVLRAVEEHRITHALWVPTMLEMLLSSPDFGKFDLSSLQRIMYGAAPMPESLLRRATEQMPQAGFIQFYGMTELSPLATCLSAEDHRDGPPHRLRSAGRPGPNVILRVVDTSGNELARGSVGEIIVSSPGVMQGYWNKPEQTAQAIRNGHLHTGDAGYMDDDGYVYVVDRLKDMIITGGENVYSTEVENALYKHAGVAECAVLGMPDAHWGEIVCAVVHPQAGQPLVEADLIEHCRSLIAGYKCPRRVIVADAPLPRTAAGKLRKSELREKLRAGAA